MKVIRNWQDLREFGINVLTGEACTLGCRALVDLTENGARNLRNFFGLQSNAQFALNWNSEAIGSCFLPWSILPDLSAFLLIQESRCTQVFQYQDSVCGIESHDEVEDVNHWREAAGADLTRTWAPLHGQPANGLSSIHVMSGRSM